MLFCLAEIRFQPALDQEKMNSLKHILRKCRSCVALSMDEFGCTSFAQNRIDTRNHPPVYQAPRRLAPTGREDIRTEVSDNYRMAPSQLLTAIRPRQWC